MPFSLKIAFLCTLPVLFTPNLAQAPASIQSPCLFNSTHCSCRNVEAPGTCLRHSGDDNCMVDKCSSAGFTCDCTGTSVCKMSSCSAWVSSAGIPTSGLAQGSSVRCKLTTKANCLNKITEQEVAAPSPEPQEFRMVQFGKGSHTTMFNMTAFVDDDNFISKTYFMHGRWKNAQRLRRRFITMRMYDADGADERMLCAIYNTYGVKNDGLGNMGARVTITGLSGQTLEWAACDDRGECKGKKGSSLVGRHGLVSYLSDGWCVKPLEWNGNVVSVKFSGVQGMKGVVLQSLAGQDQDFLFVDGNTNGMSGRFDKHGLVRDGDVPEIQFNLRGFEVPF